MNTKINPWLIAMKTTITPWVIAIILILIGWMYFDAHYNPCDVWTPECDAVIQVQTTD